MAGGVAEGADGRRGETRANASEKTGRESVLARVRTELKRDHATMVAASIAFYMMLAIFPGLIALVALYGLVADPADVQTHVSSVSSALPEDARGILESQLGSIVGQSQGGVSLGLAVSILGALWAASGGMRALMEAMNVAYDVQEERSFLRVRGIAILLTIAAIVFIAVAVFAAAVLPVIFAAVGLGGAARTVLSIARWPVLALMTMAGLAFIYRYAASRAAPPWRWVTWGSVVATLLWLGATLLFSLYVSRFGSYNETYGALGGVIVLMLWFFLTGYAALLGAEVDAELERRNRGTTDRREREPAGERRRMTGERLGPSPAG